MNGRLMKGKLFAIIAAAVLLPGCNSAYDDTALRERMDALEVKIRELSSRLELMNENVAALAGVTGAYMSGATITSVEEVYDANGTLSGYKISFSNMDPVIIHNGIDGKDGHIGVDGTPGRDGIAGHSPVVGVTAIDGVWYWTVDGELLLDALGNPIIASPDPSAAVARDGETPRISVADGNWVITVGGSSSVLGPVSDSEVLIVDGVFDSVAAGSSTVVFTLSGGETIELPRASVFRLTLRKGDSPFSVDYSVEGGRGPVTPEVITDGTWSAAVSPSSEDSGTITLTPPATYRDASFMVLAGNGESSAVSSFSIISGVVVL